MKSPPGGSGGDWMGRVVVFGRKKGSAPDGRGRETKKGGRLVARPATHVRLWMPNIGRLKVSASLFRFPFNQCSLRAAGRQPWNQRGPHQRTGLRQQDLPNSHAVQKDPALVCVLWELGCVAGIRGVLGVPGVEQHAESVVGGVQGQTANNHHPQRE